MPGTIMRHRQVTPNITIICQAFVQRLGAGLGKPVQTPEFGADMEVELVNDGPVTIIIDSKIRE